MRLNLISRQVCPKGIANEAMPHSPRTCVCKERKQDGGAFHIRLLGMQYPVCHISPLLRTVSNDCAHAKKRSFCDLFSRTHGWIWLLRVILSSTGSRVFFYLLSLLLLQNRVNPLRNLHKIFFFSSSRRLRSSAQANP